LLPFAGAAFRRVSAAARDDAVPALPLSAFRAREPESFFAFDLPVAAMKPLLS
jgi:hypothetical protein